MSLIALSVTHLASPAGPHPTTLALLVAAASYAEATAQEGTDHATLEAIDLAQSELNAAARAWIKDGRPDTWREDLAPLARSVLVASALAVVTQGAAKSLDALSLALTAWERLGFPGLPPSVDA